MTKYTNKFVTAIATVAILANGLMPIASASTTITVTGNGADSASAATVTNTQTTTVSQSNTANFTNNVGGTANTGDNDANKNTGGAVTVKTGDATVDNTVSNQANQNYANVSCACDQGDTTVKIAGNGADSQNTAKLTGTNTTNVGQTNVANFTNNVGGTAKSGNNDANKNTGGSVTVETGDASVSNDVSNWANANSAKIGGGAGAGDSVSLKIVGNGADSDSLIDVKLTDSAVVTQYNVGNITNNVGGTANTGDNDANKNTNGVVKIETGDASVDNTVDNMANFNWADLNCGCTFDGGLEATVDSNGAGTDNTIKGVFSGAQSDGQTNVANLTDNAGGDAKSGNNDANKNTGSVYDDPSVMTGDASVGSDVSNSANLNGLGGTQPTWPNWNMGGNHISVNIDIHALLAALGL